MVQHVGQNSLRGQRKVKENSKEQMMPKRKKAVPKSNENATAAQTKHGRT